MATGKAWFKVPPAIKFNLTGSLPKWVSGKDVILHIIGRIGVDGALYKSMEFAGDGIASLSMDDRFTIANMAIEAGGKNGIFPVDEKTEAYMKEHSARSYRIYEADPDAVYEEEYTIDLSQLKPTIAFPHLPENTKTIDEITEEVKIDQAVIGSCTNGRIEDLRTAAAILKGRKVKKGVRCIVIPATQAIYLQAMEEGLFEDLYRGGSRGEHPHLRSLSGRLHGDPGGRGEMHFHYQPELCGTHGPCGFGSLPGQPGGGGSQRGYRQDQRTGGTGRIRRGEVSYAGERKSV